MRIPRPLALLIGLLTVWPIIYIVGFMVVVFGAVMRATSTLQPGLFPRFDLLMAMHLGTMAVMAWLMVFYLVHVFRNPALGDKRVLWAVVLFMGSFIAMPVYWFLYVWRQRGPALAA